MSAVESRLAATLVDHYSLTVRDDGETWECLCGVVIPEPDEDAHSRHVAAMIASSDDLAVIERPVVRWGIRKVGDADSLFSVSGWTQSDAEKACSYNSERWGQHEVVRWVQSVPEGVSDRG